MFYSWLQKVLAILITLTSSVSDSTSLLSIQLQFLVQPQFLTQISFWINFSFWLTSDWHQRGIAVNLPQQNNGPVIISMNMQTSRSGLCCLMRLISLIALNILVLTRQGPQTVNMIHGQPDCRSATTCSQQTATRPTGRWLQGPEPISTKIPWSCVHYRHIANTLWPTHTYSNVLIMNAPAENYHRTPEWICVCVSIYIHFC